MKLRVLKKKLKQNCNYYETEHTSLVIEQKQAIPVKIKNKIRWKNKRGYEYIVYGAYDSFICECEEWKLYSNKELKEYLKLNKGKLVIQD